MKIFKNIVYTIAIIPFSILLYLCFAVFLIVGSIIAAPFIFVYGLVYFLYSSIEEVWCDKSQKENKYANRLLQD